MKAACLILCLALARESAGHIFRRQQQRVEDLIMQPRNYIAQQQMQSRYASQERYQPRQSSEEYQQKYLKKDKYQPKREYQPAQYRSMSSEEERQQAQAQMQRAYQKRSYQYNTQSSESQQQYEPQDYKKSKHTTQKKYQTPDSTSTESREKRIKYSVSSSEENRSTLQNTMKPYADAITWNGIKIAASKKTPITKKDIDNIFGGAYETMKHVSEEDKQIFRQQYEVAAQAANEDAQLNATELLNKHQYPVEEHTIKTDDGYLLTLFRVSKDSTVPRPVVFLMHGLLGSADDWLLMGPGKSLAYLLADAGYDVWLGNARGNKYSRRHVTKHPALADFWQFGTDEIALHDLPAMIDYVLATAGQQKLFYVGHSLGATAFFALTASRPEYNDKIAMMYALSPMAYMANARSPLLRMIAPTSKLRDSLHHQLGHGEFKPSGELVSTVGGAMIEKAIGVKAVAGNIQLVMSGVDVEALDAKLIPVIMAHLPAGASTRQMKQYAQAVASDGFAKYDFGAAINERVYGSSMPPKYDMRKVRAPVVLFYGEEDWLAYPRDVERLAAELADVRQAYKVQDPHFGAMAFQFSQKAPTAVYNKLIESINSQAQTQNYV